MRSQQIYLRFLDVGDERALLQLNIRNRDFFGKYSATREESFFTLDHHIQLIQRYKEDRIEDARYVFGIFLAADDALIGVLTLSDVIRGPMQSCYIGYSLDEGHNGKGYMSEAVRLAVGYAFQVLHLHRIEAGVMPSNPASQKVLERNGFIREGLCRKNVRINGRWEDHYLYALLNPKDERA